MASILNMEHEASFGTSGHFRTPGLLESILVDVGFLFRENVTREIFQSVTIKFRLIRALNELNIFLENFLINENSKSPRCCLTHSVMNLINVDDFLITSSHQ